MGGNDHGGCMYAGIRIDVQIDPAPQMLCFGWRGTGLQIIG